MANKPMTQKHDGANRDRAKQRRRIELQLDDVNLPMPPIDLFLANLLPEKTPMPEFRGTDEAEFGRFLDEHFPPGDERFAEFRREVAGPSLNAVLAAPRSNIFNYRIIAIKRERWWAAARINRIVAGMTNTDPGALRICDWCRKLFIANRTNQQWCTDRCGDALRHKRQRDMRKKHELQRELNISKKNDIDTMISRKNDRNKKRASK